MSYGPSNGLALCQPGDGLRSVACVIFPYAGACHTPLLFVLSRQDLIPKPASRVGLCASSGVTLRASYLLSASALVLSPDTNATGRLNPYSLGAV
jgi:hypothetical protein